MKDYSETENRYRTLCKKLHDYEEQGNDITEAVGILWMQMTTREVNNDWDTISECLDTFEQIVELEVGE